MIRWPKSLKVGNTDRYSVDLTSWLDGQAVAGATITPDAAFTSLGGTGIDGNIISWLITGLSKGVETFDIEYNTSTRSDCIKIQLEIEDC